MTQRWEMSRWCVLTYFGIIKRSNYQSLQIKGEMIHGRSNFRSLIFIILEKFLFKKCRPVVWELCFRTADKWNQRLCFHLRFLVHLSTETSHGVIFPYFSQLAHFLFLCFSFIRAMACSISTSIRASNIWLVSSRRNCIELVCPGSYLLSCAQYTICWEQEARQRLNPEHCCKMCWSFLAHMSPMAGIFLSSYCSFFVFHNRAHQPQPDAFADRRLLYLDASLYGDDAND